MNLLSKFTDSTEFSDYEDFFHNFQLKVPQNFNFGFDVVDEYARLDPQKTALVWCNDKGEEKIFSFADMKKYSDKAVHLLMQQGIKKGDFVMTILNRHYSYWIMAIACHKLGAVLVPATYLLTARDIEYRCNNVDIKIIFIIDEDEIVHHVEEALPKCKNVKKVFTIHAKKHFDGLLETLEKMPEALPSFEHPTKDDLMIVYFTSGTTGYPKMVAHKHTYAAAHIITALYWHNIGEEDLHFTMAESGWGKFSWGKIYGQWICGSTVFGYDFFGRFTPSDVLPLIDKYKITSFCAPPTIYRFLIKEDLSHYNLKSLKHCTTAGEALNPEVFKQFEKATGVKIYEAFGQTETAPILGTFKYTVPHTGSLGKPCPLYEIEVVDDNENPVPIGQVGQLVIANKPNMIGIFAEYYKDAEKTKHELNGKYYHTYDLVREDSEGYYWFVGRKDDMIKSSGYRIGPFEVESALMEHPSVLECAITAVPDEIRGQIVKASIVLAQGYTPSDELIKELQNHVKRITAPYKYPRVIEFLKMLPKTHSGKIRRIEIRGEKDK